MPDAPDARSLVTRFGEPWAPPQRAAAVLRARASAVGIELLAASEDDLVAAVLGAEAWLIATGRESLGVPAAAGAPAVRALLAVLHRAAGCPLDDPATVLVSTADVALIAEVDVLARVAAQVTPSPASALLAAAADLSHAGPVGRLASVADLLVTCAEVSLESR